MLQPGDKKALAILGAVIVAALVIIAGATTLLVRGHEKPLPTVAFQAGDDLTQASTPLWCSATMTDCKFARANGDVSPIVADHAVAIGDQAVISVPKEVADGPWALIAEYATKQGIQRVQYLHMPNEMFTQVLRSEPDRVLLGIEVSAISAVMEQVPGQPESTDGDLAIRGVFAVRTLPVGFQIPNMTELPGVKG
ncbi:DUF2771 family protein [Gordonia sp. (in: high G+C Gram-positive bacteria)]|uniref:DUF2771 family protein n=1 Tax=Gordonia sp. (in: high G+C Gram-positive bacteria) TaxID=84139 RepID=UPI003C711268